MWGSWWQLPDVPSIDEKTYSFDLHELIDKPATFTMDDILSGSFVSRAVEALGVV